MFRQQPDKIIKVNSTTKVIPSAEAIAEKVFKKQ
jgi:hypothetical protein